MKKKFDGLNGLRTILCIGIVLMHVKANTSYNINNYLYNTVISSFANFVYLFMIISSFGMCCGYYNKIKNAEIMPNEFFKRRIGKILPFFAVVVLIDVVFEHSLLSVLEGLANLTLMFGLAPNYEISVIGVGWFMGVVFLFYVSFPYFVFLIDNKKRAWLTLIISVFLNFLCIGLLNIGKKNILFDLCFFVLGGLIYLYKEDIVKLIRNKKILSLIVVVLVTSLYYIIPNYVYLNTIKLLILYAIWISFAISYDGKILNNNFTGFISKISMEIYLSHMVIFRLIEKIKLTNLLHAHVLNFCKVFIMTVIGTIIFDLIVNKCLDFVYNLYNRKENIKE